MESTSSEELRELRRRAALRRLARELWVADRGLKLMIGDIGTRMTVIRLASGDLFVHSPVRLDAETRRALDDLGPVRHVVAPSKVHHFFVGDYPAVHDEATVYGASGLSEEGAYRHWCMHRKRGRVSPAWAPGS